MSSSAVEWSPELEGFSSDDKSMIEECLSLPSVDTFLSRAITKVLLFSKYHQKIFQEMENSKTFKTSDFFSIVNGSHEGDDKLLNYCQSLLKEIDGNNHKNGWSNLGKFYRSFPYSSFINLLFRYALSVDDISFEGQGDISAQVSRMKGGEYILALGTSSQNSSVDSEFPVEGDDNRFHRFKEAIASSSYYQKRKFFESYFKG